jgi:glycine cleavage system H protein
MSSIIPGNLKYAKSHEWAKIENGHAIIGITDHAQHELTDVVFVELPELGRTILAGESCAVVESVKTASDIYAPLGGEVVAVNKAVIDNPSLVNTDPYGEGWFFKIKLSKPEEAAALLTPDQYQASIHA